MLESSCFVPFGFQDYHILNAELGCDGGTMTVGIAEGTRSQNQMVGCDRPVQDSGRSSSSLSMRFGSRPHGLGLGSVALGGWRGAPADENAQFVMHLNGRWRETMKTLALSQPEPSPGQPA